MHCFCVVWCLFVLLAGGAWAQSEAPSERPAQAPATPDLQARGSSPGGAWACEIAVLTMTGTSPSHRLSDVCGNYTGRVRIVTNVACKTQRGTVQFRPELTGGDATSILALPFTCTETWRNGVLNGQPRIAPFATTSMACPGHCTIDFVVSDVQDASSATLVVAGEYE